LVQRLIYICFDRSGNAYIAGMFGVLKLNGYGIPLRVNKRLTGNIKIVCKNGLLYVFSNVRSPYNNGVSQAVYILDHDLKILSFAILSKKFREYAAFSLGKASFDNHAVYVAGTAYTSPVNERNHDAAWVVYSISTTSLGERPGRCVVEIENVTVPVNYTRTVKIWLVNCSYAAGIVLRLKFDPSIIKVVGVKSGEFAKAVKDVFTKEINNKVGTVGIAVAGVEPCGSNNTCSISTGGRSL